MLLTEVSIGRGSTAVVGHSSQLLATINSPERVPFMDPKSFMC